jgi:hypothetical protein
MEPTFEQITVMDQMKCSRKQISFKIQALPLSHLIGLNILNLGYINYKKN